MSEAAAWGIASIVTSIAVGILVFILDLRRRRKEEEHAKNIVVNNLESGKKIFVDLTKTAKRPDSEEFEDEILSEIDDYFQENHEKIRDIIRFSRLYLNEWKSLPKKDKQNIEQSVNNINWLLTDFYPMQKPDIIKHGKVIENRINLNKKRDELVKIVNELKKK